ncbi:hypothetical protein DL96DRAFT_1638202 [Flagelloscypha sp. PMI_526]|nr:hypothetical protein DL96DRAFT_1638202 [Flagelloscypha sp. PMI_526]
MSSPSPDVLVTGSSGHLGTALILSLPSYGYTPLGLDITESPTTSIIGSITSREVIRATLENNPSIRFILHAATLHKPHVESHSKEAFVQTNVLGTLVLLEEAVACGHIESFVFTSTTSTFGRALTPQAGETQAVWIDESVIPTPKNIYGVTKVSAESLCELVQLQNKDLSVIVLRTSRFFPEADDVEERRMEWPDDDNLKVNELTYRRADISDMVSAHVCAIEARSKMKWGGYIISAPPPFTPDIETRGRLHTDAGSILKEAIPNFESVYHKKGWSFPKSLDRVYDSSKAVRELGWNPVYTFERALEKLENGEEWKSDLWIRVGKKGYHAESTGVYTIR